MRRKESKQSKKKEMANVFSGEGVDCEIEGPGSEAAMVEASVEAPAEVDGDVVVVAEEEVERATKKVKLSKVVVTIPLGTGSTLMHRIGNGSAASKHQIRLEFVCKYSNGKPGLALLRNTVTFCMWLKANKVEPRTCFDNAEFFGDLPGYPFKANSYATLMKAFPWMDKFVYVVQPYEFKWEDKSIVPVSIKKKVKQIVKNFDQKKITDAFCLNIIKKVVPDFEVDMYLNAFANDGLNEDDDDGLVFSLST